MFYISQLTSPQALKIKSAKSPKIWGRGVSIGNEQVMSVSHIFKKSYIFWDGAPCSTFKVNWSFGETFNSACYLVRGGSFMGLFINPENGGDKFLRNVACLSKRELFIIIKVRTSNSVYIHNFHFIKIRCIFKATINATVMELGGHAFYDYLYLLLLIVIYLLT